MLIQLPLRLKLFILLGVFFSLDWIVWELGIWKIPNEANWGTDFFYNFVYEKKRILSSITTNRRVLVMGSSVARYSFDPQLLQEYLNSRGKDVDVRLLSHAGFTPIDAYAQREEIIRMNPEIIVYPLNFVDFRIFRAFEIYPEKPLSTVDENLLISDSLNPTYSPQAKFAYPYSVLRDFHNYLNLENKAMFLSAYLFSFYRYREIAYDNLKYVYNHRYSRNTSYYWYSGVQIPERVSTLGWTGKRFSFEWNESFQKKGFYVQIVPEILKKGNLSLVFLSDKHREDRIFTEPGWKQIHLENFSPGEQIICELSETWIPFDASGDRFDYAKEPMGVRLQETFGLDSPKRDYHIVREERSEDLRFKGMTEAEYRDYFQFRLLQDRDKRPGLVTMTLYKDAKERLHREQFRAFFHYRYLKEFLNSMSEKEIKVLFILNPENPFSYMWYEDSMYHKDEVQYLKSLENKNLIFWNLTGKLAGNQFSDYHHMTFGGMQEMLPVYGQKIFELLE